MSKNKNFRTEPQGDGWAVRREGSASATSVHRTQEEAWSDARRRARGAEGEAILQGRDGRVRARNTYGSHPFPPKG